MGSTAKSPNSGLKLFASKLLGIFAVILLGFVAVIWAFNSSPQVANMRAVDNWRSGPEVVEKVNRFKNENGLDFILFTQTRHQGVVGVQVRSEHAHRAEEILSFMMSLNPPRPVEMQTLLANGKSSVKLQTSGQEKP